MPRGVVESQEQLVDRLARGLAATVARSRKDLIAAGDAYVANPARTSVPAQAREAALSSIVTAGQPWQGADLVTASSRQSLAHRGQQLDLNQLPKSVATATVVPLIAAGTDPKILIAVTLPDDQLLVASAPLRIRPLYLNADTQQSVLIAAPHGKSAGNQGKPVSAADRPVAALILKAVARTPKATVTSVVGNSTTTTPEPLAGHPRSTAPLVAAAAIGDLGIAVVSVVWVDVVAPTTRWRGWPVALGLLGVALVVFLLLEMAVVTPINRVLTKAKAVASGDIDIAVGRIRGVEARRIAAVLDAIAARFAIMMKPPARYPDRLSRRPSGTGPMRAAPGRMRAASAVLIAAGLIAGWASLVAYRYAYVSTKLPRQIAYDTGNVTDGVAIAIRDCFGNGLNRLTIEARKPGAGDTDTTRSSISNLVGNVNVFRSAYLTDARGHVLLKGGYAPLRSGKTQPRVNGVFLDHPGGRIPIIYTAVALANNRFLVGEFNVHHLIALMRRADNRLRVVDAQMRVILDTKGYIPFEKLSSTSLRRAVTRTNSGERVAAVTSVNGVRTLVASAVISREGATAPPGFSLISQRATSTFRLPDNEPRRAAWLVSCLGFGVAAMLRFWYGLTVLGALRTLAAAADRLAAGDVRSVVTAMRHDEIGSIALCLDICRQVLIDGPARFGGATRYGPTAKRC